MLKYLPKITRKAVKEYSNIDLPNSKAFVSPFSFLYIVLLEAAIDSFFKISISLYPSLATVYDQPQCSA